MWEKGGGKYLQGEEREGVCVYVCVYVCVCVCMRVMTERKRGVFSVIAFS